MINKFFDNFDYAIKNLDKKKNQSTYNKYSKNKKKQKAEFFFRVGEVLEMQVMQLTIFVNFVILNVMHQQTM